MDPFSGGLAAYGLFLLVTSIVLQHVEIFDIEGMLEENQDYSSFTCTSSLPCNKFTEEQINYGKETAISVCRSAMFLPVTASCQLLQKGKAGFEPDQFLVEQKVNLGMKTLVEMLFVWEDFFMHILHFIGRSFDPKIDNVSIRYGSLAVNGNMDPIMLDDPLSPGNNVGRRCYKISDIQKLCGDALNRLYSILIRSKGRNGVESKSMPSVIDQIFPGCTFESKN